MLSPNAMSARSPGPRIGAWNGRPGAQIPLCSAKQPPSTTVHSTRLRQRELTETATSPSPKSTRSNGRRAASSSACGTGIVELSMVRRPGASSTR